ncbi:MAG: hypothetical protein ACREE6_03440, partial [Limisphaerales bacterium]
MPRLTPKKANPNRSSVLFSAIALLLAIGRPCPGQTFIPLSFAESGGTNCNIVERYGVPFQHGDLNLVRKGSTRLNVGRPVKRIFVLGMTEKANLFCWASPLD